MTAAAWYLARGTGVVSLVLLTLVMVIGIGSRSGRAVAGLPRFAVALVHRNASLLASCLIVVHIVTLLLDPYAQLRLVDVVVPFGASYRPVWVGLGTLALDLIVALVATSLLRGRLGARTWRVVHWFAYAAWPIAWLHGIGTGTDRGSGWYLAIAIASLAAVIAAVVWRLRPGFDTLGGRRARRRMHDALRRDEKPITTTYGRSSK
jgi:methionine sulfoxide reductase heme-binding subunit